MPYPTRAAAARASRSPDEREREYRMPDKPRIAIADDARKQAIAALREYVADNLDEEIGDLKAALLFDFIVTELGPTIYNQAIADARAFFEERASDLASECYHKEFPSTIRRKR
jgi:uncharacterized protein (DUF2164 family)